MFTGQTYGDIRSYGRQNTVHNKLAVLAVLPPSIPGIPLRFRPMPGGSWLIAICTKRSKKSWGGEGLREEEGIEGGRRMEGRKRKELARGKVEEKVAKKEERRREWV